MVYAVQKRSRPFSENHKAGIFIFGEKDGQMQVVAPWSQGNFSTSSRKTYMLPKGSVDADETPYEAAIREVAEETGVYLDILRNDPRPQKEQRCVFDPENPRHQWWKAEGIDCFYPNVSIKCWLGKSKTPSADGAEPEHSPIIDDFLPTMRNRPAHHHLYGVILNGIEHLNAPGILKHGFNGTGHGDVRLTAEEQANQLIAQNQLPDYQTLHEVMRTGKWHWHRQEGEPADTLFAPVLQMAEDQAAIRKELASYHAAKAKPSPRQTLKAIEAIMSGQKTFELRDFDALFQTSSLQSTFREQLKILRDYMAGKAGPADAPARNPLLSDDNGLKLDTNQHPLQYYQEGADIIPAPTYLQRMVDALEVMPVNDLLYGNSTFSAYVQESRAGRHYSGTHLSVAQAALKATEQALAHTGETLDHSLKLSINNLTRDYSRSVAA